MTLITKLKADIEKAVAQKLAALGNPVGGKATRAAPVKIKATPDMSKTLNSNIAAGVTAQSVGVQPVVQTSPQNNITTPLNTPGNNPLLSTAEQQDLVLGWG